MFRRAVLAFLAPVALSACWPWHMFSRGGSPCKEAIDYGRRRVTVDATTVPINGGRGAGEELQIGQVEVSPDLARRASDVVQQFDHLQLATCETMRGLKSEDRAPYAELRVQVLTDFAFILKGLGQAPTASQFAAAVTDGQARLGHDSLAVGQLGSR